MFIATLFVGTAPPQNLSQPVNEQIMMKYPYHKSLSQQKKENELKINNMDKTQNNYA